MIAEPDRIELVQRRHLAARVPPVGGQRAKTARPRRRRRSALALRHLAAIWPSTALSATGAAVAGPPTPPVCIRAFSARRCHQARGRPVRSTRTRRSSMARLVMKFGGTSVADIDRIRNVARHVKREVDAGHEVAVVVSAMSGKTNELVGLVPRGRAAARRPRIRRRRRLRRAGHLRPAGHRAGRHGHQRPLLAGLADSDPDHQRARLRPHPGHQRRRADQALQGARARSR